MTTPVEVEGPLGRLLRVAACVQSSVHMRLLVAVTVAVLVVASAGLVYAAGGTQHAWVHLLYVPVLVAAWAFGPVGGVVAGVAAGVAVGPGMPVDVAEGVAQGTANWVYRLGFFALIGSVSGALHQLLRLQLGQARAQQRRFASLVDHAPDVILACDADGVVTYASPSVARVLGYGVAEVVGRRVVDYVHADDVAALSALGAHSEAGAPVEVRARHADASWRHLEVVVSNLLEDPAVEAVVCNARDVTERRAVESELRHQAWHDAATGLANRERFTDVLREALAGDADHGQPAPRAVLLVTLDRFEQVQQSLGADTGEQLITALAKRLSALMRPGDLLARLATTEFAVLCPGVASRDDARGIAERLRVAADEPFLLVRGEVHLSASIGVALASDADHDADQLLCDVHTAAHRAAPQGSRVALFDLAWRHQAATAVDTETALHSALRRDQFTLVYQPVIDLTTERIVGVEALIRWQHPRLGTVPPSDFIPLAEHTGMIGPIGRWVLDTACAQLARWRDQLGRDDLTLAVNISARQLDDPALVDHITTALTDHALPPDALTLELTETALVGDTSRTIEALTTIKALGVRVAVDDFGTGYSSLGYLKQLPVDVLKIDRVFVSQLGNANDDAIISAIIGLARTLGLDTVAEGIEDPTHGDRLRELGCDHAQGYYYARPQPAHAITPLLTAHYATTP